MKVKHKALKELAQINENLLRGILGRIRNAVEYSHIQTDEDRLKLLTNIATPDKWNYIGLISNEDKAIKEVLEYLMDKESTKIRINNWTKPNQD